MKPISLMLVFLIILSGSFVSSAQIPANYYDNVDATNAITLRQTLHQIIDDHTRHPYSSSATDNWDILDSADQDPNSTKNILDIYRNTSITKQGGGNDYYNREHSWPKSYGFPNNVVSNYPYTDCHALFLCNSNYNSSRGNKPYRYCDEDCSERPTEENNNQGGGSGVYPGYSNWTSGSSTTGRWETWVSRRGDVARALFYLDVRYEGGTHGITNIVEPDLILTNDETLIASSHTGNNETVAYMGMLSVLLEWHRQDPVDEIELRRNDIIYSFQNNRNPFIDHPEWVECIFADNCASDIPPVAIWINELHYDNKGADADEFVEIAGTAGTDLSGWLLIGYNGASGRVYRTVQLSGVIPDDQNGIGTLAFDFVGLQNGSPDGIALVGPDDTVIEFLSYEGSFTAADGPAAGRASVDIGVSESNSTRTGRSLQLSGSGTVSSDFSWQPASSSTRGQRNSGQSF